MVAGDNWRLDDIAEQALASGWYRWGAGTESSLSYVADIAAAWQEADPNMSAYDKAIIGLRATGARFAAERPAFGLIETGQKEIKETVDNALGLVIVDIKGERFTFDAYAVYDVDEYNAERYEEAPSVEDLCRSDSFCATHKVEEAAELLEIVDQNPYGIRIGDEIATWLS